MDWNKFKHKFHKTWHFKMKPFVESKACDDIFTFLKSVSASGKKIAPESVNTFRAFLTPYSELNAVIIGMCPYNNLVDGVYAADGLAFSCGLTKKEQPSLNLFNNAIEKEIYNGLTFDHYKETDLQYLQDQGIMLINAGLTVQVGGKAGEHNQRWRIFMQYFLQDCIKHTGIPVVFVGKDAEELKYHLPGDYPYMIVEHPSYAARQMRPWKSDGLFNFLDKKIKEINGITIEWLPKMPF